MPKGKAPNEVSLIDVLIDGFEKNEILHGFHWRELPMPDAGSAQAKFADFVGEATRWKGAPTQSLEQPGRRCVQWPDLEILQADRGIMVRVRAPWFSTWWSDPSTWDGDPMAALHDWLAE